MSSHHLNRFAGIALALVLASLIGQLRADHQLGSISASAEQPSVGESIDSGSMLAATDDLMAAESSSSAASGGAAEHKSYRQESTNPQVASVAPTGYSVAPGHHLQPQHLFQQPQFVHQQPAHQIHQHQRQLHQPNSQHHQHHQPTNQRPFNPFMAAALAGTYGPQQQHLVAASLQQQQHQYQQQQHQNQIHHQPQHPAMVMAAPQQQQPQQVAGIGAQESQVRQVVAATPAAQGMQFVQPQAQAQQQQQQQQQVQPQQPPIDSNAVEPANEAASSATHSVVVPAGSSSSPSAVSAGSQSTELAAWPLQAPEIPKIVNLEVKCEKNLMKVSIEFDKIFNGVIFSKGHFSQGQCIHVSQNSAKQQAYFDIGINTCGTQGNTQNGLYGMGGNTGSGTFFENTIVIQYDPNVQEVYDHARKLRCTWHDQYEKAVTFRPFPVDMLDIVRADFAGDNVGCWMQIQVGKGPWASEVAGIVKIGQTMTMVLAIKDEENKFDMLVRNCFAHDGKRGPIELVDKSGCITRPKLMSRFTKIKNFGSSATVLSYAHFQAFKFPDSMEVHFQCTIQICRHQCPDQCSAGSSSPGISSSGSNSGSTAGETYSESTISGTFNINGPAGSGSHSSGDHLRKFGSTLSRARRDLEATNLSANRSQQHHQGPHLFQVKPLVQTVGLNRVIQVVSTGDLAFALAKQPQQQIVDGQTPEAAQWTSAEIQAGQVCMSSFNFVLGLVMLVLVLLCSCLAAVSLYMRHKQLAKRSSKLLGSPSSASASGFLPTSNKPIQNHHHHQLHHPALAFGAPGKLH